ncbi:hypothetical protein GCM10011574_59310 [Microbispora bryophytorum]|uniref:Uncharacterized protein n=1 Tax=Microbispora bryophytorum TaxID=1460882 RepID=A0A8H9H4J0_9ACTN|nr:hypothetical protein GCM10011574_59310 [Microbispora bryophytorum]
MRGAGVAGGGLRVGVLVGLTVTSFGGSVLAGVESGRDRAAVTSVGADARVQTFGALPQGLGAQGRKVTGVREATGVRIGNGQRIANSSTRFDLLVVDPEPYARLVAATGLGSSLRADRLDSGTSGAIPAIASPAVVRKLGKGVGDPETVRSSGGSSYASSTDRTPHQQPQPRVRHCFEGRPGEGGTRVQGAGARALGAVRDGDRHRHEGPAAPSWSRPRPRRR